MKKIVVTILVLLTGLNSIGQGIKFERELSWEQLQNKAVVEKKFIFIDAMATWCVPCKLMSKETFTNEEVGSLVDSNFISVKVQMDQSKEDDAMTKAWYKDAQSLKERYRVSEFPTILYFSPEGLMIHKAVGYLKPQELISETKKALEKGMGYRDSVLLYHEGKLDSSGIKTLAMRSKAFRDTKNTRIFANAYTALLSKEDLKSKDKLLFISRTLNSDSKYFPFFLKNSKEVNETMNKKNFAENSIMDVAFNEEIAPFDQAEKPDWSKIEENVKKKYGRLGEERVWGNMTVYYDSKKDWQNFGKYYKLYFDSAIPNERSFLHINNVSWTVVEQVNNREVLRTALKAIKYSIEKFDSKVPNTYDTYANLLYKLGRKKEAIEWEEKAVKLSENGQDFLDTLEKMKRGDKIYPIN